MENKKISSLMFYVSRELARRNSEYLSGLGLTGAQLQTLVFIYRNAMHGKSVCQRDVERELNLRASSVSALLVNLTSSGYITREHADGDARTKLLALTAEGEQLCLKNKALIESCDGMIRDALSEEEQAQFRALLLKIYGHLKA